jgi:ssDNA-binding Zn-finger/Zn-ribbon topoisomerase 1
MKRTRSIVEPVTDVRCPECGNEQADMGNGVQCEECGKGPMPTKDRRQEDRRPVPRKKS